MWHSLSRDVLLYEIIPYTDPQQLSLILKLNKNTNRIAKEYKPYKANQTWWAEHLRILPPKIKLNKQNYRIENLNNALESGNTIWAIYYSKRVKGIKPSQLLHSAFVSGNIDLIKHFEPKVKAQHRYGPIAVGLTQAVIHNNQKLIDYILDTYSEQTIAKKIDYATATYYAAKQGNQKLVTIFLDRTSEKYKENTQAAVITGSIKKNHLDILKYIVDRYLLAPSAEYLVQAILRGYIEMSAYITGLIGVGEYFEEAAQIIFDMDEVDTSHDEVIRMIDALYELLKDNMPPDFWRMMIVDAIYNSDENKATLSLRQYRKCNLQNAPLGASYRDMQIQIGIAFENTGLIEEAMATGPNDLDQYLFYATLLNSLPMMKFFCEKGARDFDRVLSQLDEPLADTNYNELRIKLMTLKLRYTK
jgi:hypothetical protein